MSAIVAKDERAWWNLGPRAEKGARGRAVFSCIMHERRAPRRRIRAATTPNYPRSDTRRRSSIFQLNCMSTSFPTTDAATRRRRSFEAIDRHSSPRLSFSLLCRRGARRATRRAASPLQSGSRSILAKMRCFSYQVLKIAERSIIGSVTLKLSTKLPLPSFAYSRMKYVEEFIFFVT